MYRRILLLAILLLVATVSGLACAEDLPVVPDVEGQPLAANVRRLMEALEFLGHPLPDNLAEQIESAARGRDAGELQRLLDQQVLFAVHINPEYRVKVQRGPAKAVIQQDGYTPVLVKIHNEGAVTERLRVSSPQAGKVYAGVSQGSLSRQQQLELGDNQNKDASTERFLDVEMFTSPPMTAQLSGLAVEYAIALIGSSESGRREATIVFDVGQGTQDLGFRSEVPILFDVRPAIPVTLWVLDNDGKPTAARLIFRDVQGRIYPPQAKRVAPDFFFQPQIYREDGQAVLLPPGEFELRYCRGPEYLVRTAHVTVAPELPAEIRIQLTRWVNPVQYGWYCGDHHIHAAGCAHYQVPTLGVRPQDMFVQVKGEGLNVGCILTWGPCFDYQRQFFAPAADAVSEPDTVLKYDLEISGFGSAPLGHVCLLNLIDEAYPGTNGTSENWPTWTVPVLAWAKQQGGVTGYPHSDMRVDPEGYAAWKLGRLDQNHDGQLTTDETHDALLPADFADIDSNGDGNLSLAELTATADRKGNELPNLVLPSMRGSGAMEIFVSVPAGVCDFISAMDTGRIGEWNTWYHLMNCGFPVKLSGETDFPCMSSRRVGQGRVYVRMSDGPIESLDFGEWCRGIAAGRSYVSDGYAHALQFSVNDVEPGFGDVTLDEPATVTVHAEVAFAPETPEAVAYGTQPAPEGRRELGDTRELHGVRTGETVRGGQRLVEIVMNGRVVNSEQVPADGETHELQFEIQVEKSSWIALRQFPQLHTNPVNVIVADQPIRASADSARWCAESVELLWERRSRLIAEDERAEAKAAYQRAIETYRGIEGEATSE